MKNLLDISKKVKIALKSGKPVLALESTIISHGMSYPKNVETTHSLFRIAKSFGVTPALVAIINGKIKIGLNSKEIENFAMDKNVQKVSRQNLIQVLYKKQNGSTTVAATMIIANMVGIKTFSTGGIGGVHRFAQESFDISQDLIEFTKTPVVVICAGAKAILDIPKTVEYLETMGVPLFGYKTSKLPLFYSATSSIPISKVNSAKEIVEIFNLSKKIGLGCGMLVANPIPKVYELNIDNEIENAVEKAKSLKITGSDMTPFLLGELESSSCGRSLAANIRLIENNVVVGCKIAKEFSKKR